METTTRVHPSPSLAPSEAPRSPSGEGPRFIVLRPLYGKAKGSGWIAEDRWLHRLVLLRRVREADTLDRQLLHDRLQTLSEIRVPGLPLLLDARRRPAHDDMIYLWEGSLPYQALRNGQRPLPPSQTLHLIEAAANALDALHRRGLAHGNLGPDTLWLTHHGAPSPVLLLDPGLPLVPPADAEANPWRRSPSGASHLAERARDVYALASWCFELLVGAAPPADHSPDELSNLAFRHMPEAAFADALARWLEAAFQPAEACAPQLAPLLDALKGWREGESAGHTPISPLALETPEPSGESRRTPRRTPPNGPTPAPAPGPLPPLPLPPLPTPPPPAPPPAASPIPAQRGWRRRPLATNRPTHRRMPQSRRASSPVGQRTHRSRGPHDTNPLPARARTGWLAAGGLAGLLGLGVGAAIAMEHLPPLPTSLVARVQPRAADLGTPWTPPDPSTPRTGSLDAPDVELPADNAPQPAPSTPAWINAPSPHKTAGAALGGRTTPAQAEGASEHADPMSRGASRDINPSEAPSPPCPRVGDGSAETDEPVQQARAERAMTAWHRSAPGTGSAAAPLPHRRGLLRVDTDVPAEVFVDGRWRGRAPGFEIPLGAGRYLVRTSSAAGSRASWVDVPAAGRGIAEHLYQGSSAERADRW